MDSKVIIKRHPQARYIKLQVDPIKKVPVLIAPKRCSQKTIDQFIKKYEEWITTQLLRYAPNDGSLPSLILYKGEEYQINFIPCERKSYVTLDTQEKKITIHGSQLTQKMSLIRFFKKEAMQDAVTYLEKFQKLLNVKIQRIGVKDYKSRWGCCYKRGDIFLSWRLIMAPSHVFEYVCAHEAAHLIHQNHSSDFWQVVVSLLPSFEVSYRWLKKNGPILFHKI